MIVFQLIAVPIVVLLLLRSAIRAVRGDRPRWTALLGIVVWAAAGTAILAPDLTNRVAGWLGIGRGADLLIYVVALSFAVVAFYFYQRFRKLESQITEIVRELAIRGPGKDGS
jgi:hypothetical protein